MKLFSLIADIASIIGLILSGIVIKYILNLKNKIETKDQKGGVNIVGAKIEGNKGGGINYTDNSKR